MFDERRSRTIWSHNVSMNQRFPGKRTKAEPWARRENTALAESTPGTLRAQGAKPGRSLGQEDKRRLSALLLLATCPIR